MPGVRWGRRVAILNDITPAAAFISHNYNARVDLPAFRRDAEAPRQGREGMRTTLPHGPQSGADPLVAPADSASRPAS